MVGISYTPSWAEHEKGMWSEDADVQRASAARFDEERKKEMVSSAKAREFETERKKEWARNKPEWKKRKLKENDEKLQAFFKSLKQLGVFSKLKPNRGYILVGLDDEPEQVTSSGILIPGEKREENTGIVLEVGKEIVLKKGRNIESPVKRGDHILFKRGAGADALVGSHTCRLMQFDDVLAVIDK